MKMINEMEFGPDVAMNVYGLNPTPIPNRSMFPDGATKCPDGHSGVSDGTMHRPDRDTYPFS